MNISRFFVDRPVFAGVLSILIVVAGLLGMRALPISEYPEVVPPSVVVRATYPGANPTVIAETVATPLEEQINGVEDMLYMGSQATSDGVLTLTVTFKLGTDPDKAQQLVQNRVSQAEPRLPAEVRALGITTVKSSPDFIMVVNLVSKTDDYDITYLRNYATLNVKDRLARIEGVGQVQVFGAGDYSMRVWLDPQKVAEHDLAASDVSDAIRQQNVQAAAGVIGASPSPNGVDLQLNVNAQGRLTTPEEFGNIIVKSGANGEITRLRDVARIELGAADYTLRSLLDGEPAVAVAVLQAPGSNAIEIADNVRATMDNLQLAMPDGVKYEIVYDTTKFVRSSIEKVVDTLLEAVGLVVLVVILFLQTWRASIIPLIAVPVSIIGTFAVMYAFGFSINALTLFGLVLAIGIVVDDAIVVVENVERNIENGLSPRDATYKAMREVSGPIIAIALVLVAVFVPLAFISGLSGQFYRQFALTIAISTVISAINSLTLSPALAALLLKEHGAPKDWLTRFMDKIFGWFFRGFNRAFGAASNGYGKTVGGLVTRKSLVMMVYMALVAATYGMFTTVPSGFVPAQDKQYLIGFAQLPDGATLDRTESVIKRMSAIAMETPGVSHAIAFPGLSINGFTIGSNSGIVFAVLDDFEKRKTPELSGGAIAMQLNQKFAGIQDAFIAMFPPPPVNGLGQTGGFKLQIEDRAGYGYQTLDEAAKAVIAKAYQTPELAGIFSSYQINVPQLFADLDRAKAEQLGVSVSDVFQTLQIYLGSLYVNDFNAFGRTYSVRVQADSQFRAHAEDIGRLKVRSATGQMIPLSTLLKVDATTGPERTNRYNGFLAADINGGPAPGFSSGQAQAAMEKILAENLPAGIDYEWTDLTYQQILAGNSSIVVFPLALLLVYLVLAAQYESLTLPIAIILIVPLGVLAALTGVWLTGGDNNIFTQIGLVVLVGLSAKNAILIVEFARELEFEGRTPLQAAIEASRLRLRPILMTSLAFIMGVVPLVVSTGAGAEMRAAMGVAVFSGMIGVTFFGIFMTPVFYVLVRKLAGNRPLIQHSREEPANSDYKLEKAG
ncbi:efflux RND transporter permease subunit [Agrobacterium salinitolerans]|uniref:Efflux pump membrane transporter n=1 Tax=Agrobacterium salinitolerans TaxID=1183413 RepID=A0A1S9F522_9HYPH|nr:MULTISPECIES: multidrug efflux RND transporter permease subunit [Agrobacterium]MBA4776650.1 efflux RND transporter permease subunit [Hyphomicrobiales bacterium]PNQ26245.1 AcrB/AcrD/AcrF family protein [Rhizobium sp. YIC5082]MCZ7858194.1 multidrug efflux RND transporter permease subunit [Agrobacterium salinitolerans]MCZ7864449.1 multidrug efflux RND transporter permease subunit [Agrobacterium salinitolerans]MCZ7887687.1 multidrug efflux RND transporter permease subunit [Agrobacterium salinit